MTYLLSYYLYICQASLGSKMAQKMTFGFFGGSSQRVEYVRLRGPHDKGHAEIAVSKPKGFYFEQQNL